MTLAGEARDWKSWAHNGENWDCVALPLPGFKLSLTLFTQNNVFFELDQFRPSHLYSCLTLPHRSPQYYTRMCRNILRQYLNSRSEVCPPGLYRAHPSVQRFSPELLCVLSESTMFCPHIALCV